MPFASNSRACSSGSPDAQPLQPPMTDPVFLATAVEAVLRAGDVQMAHLGTDLQIEKKGRIDLVTEVDVAVERMFRAMIADRFPDHQVVAEELGGEEPSGFATAGCSIRWTAPTTTRT